jgi:atypical dual specificity phosphatase
MWNWRLNWNVVRHDLVVGSCPRKISDLDEIRLETRVSAILSLQHDECLEKQEIDYPLHVRHGRLLGLTMERCPLRDFDPDDQRRGLPEAVRMLHGLLRHGHRVYVHCTAGLNRSSLVVLAHLTWIEGASVEDAMKLMLHARPEICPTWEAYHGCRQDLTARHEERIRQRAFELGQRQPQRDARDHWLQAEREIWREVLTADEPRAKQELNEPGKAAR